MSSQPSENITHNTLKFQLFSLAFVGLSVSISSPIDFVRNRLQVMPQLIQMGRLNQPYRGAIDCARRVAKEEGLRAFWKGNLSMLCRVVPMQTLVFALKERMQKAFHYHHHFSDSKNFVINSAIGVTSSFFISFFLYPFEYIRQQLANRTDHKRVGIFKTMRQTIKANGVKGLFHGASLSLGASQAWRAIYFGMYDSLKIKTEDELIRFSYCYLSLLVGTIATCPADCVRRRKVANIDHYSSVVDCIRSIYRREGICGLYLGWQMIWLQCVSLSVFFFLYDAAFTDYKEAYDQ